MNSKIVLTTILVIVVAGGLIWYVTSNKDNTETNANTNTAITNTTNTVANANASATNTQANSNILATNTPPGANTNTGASSNINATNTNSQQDSSQDTEISMQLDEYSFSPNTITIQEGDTITLRLSNIGNMEHDFVIDALDIDSGTLDPGDSTTITITGSQAGTFEFYCSIGSHRAFGMRGTLTVI